jgi:hypothetical protein
MFTNASTKLSNPWSVHFGVHAGDDIAPWNAAAQPNGMAMLRWVSKNNNDSIWAGRFKDGHDDLPQDNLTWTHRFIRCLSDHHRGLLEVVALLVEVI